VSGLDHPTQEVSALLPTQPHTSSTFQHHLGLPHSNWKRCQPRTLQSSKDPLSCSEELWGPQNNTLSQAPRKGPESIPAPGLCTPLITTDMPGGHWIVSHPCYLQT